MLIDHRDQQIVLRKTRNLESCFGTNVGTNQAKIEKLSISRAIRLEFLHSQVSTIRCEASKSNRRREERLLGSPPSKCWVTCCCARAVSRSMCHVAAANARAEVRASMHNWSIWCQRSSRTLGCVIAHSKTRPARGEPTAQNSMRGGGIVDSSVDSARFLAFTR